MEHEIELKLTLRESDFLSELLGKSSYGYGSDVRDSVVEKLEGKRLEVIQTITKPKTEQDFFDEYMRLVGLQDYNENARGGSKGFIFGRKEFDEVLALMVEMEEANLNQKYSLNKNFRNYFFKCKHKDKHPDTDEEIEISNIFSICIFNGFWMELRWG